MNLLLTFNSAERVRKGIEIARERLEEVNVMVEENKLNAAEKAKDAQLNVLSMVKNSISDIKDANSTKQIEEEIEIEKELEEHEEEVEEVSNKLKVKIEIKGALDEQQKALISSILSSIQNKTGEVKIEIKNKKDKTKIKIETGKSEKEVEDEKGLFDIKKEEAMEEIKDAKENLQELESKISRCKLNINKK